MISYSKELGIDLTLDEELLLNSTEEITDNLYQKLFDHFIKNGEMPYDVAKARTADPFTWVDNRLRR